MTDPRIAALAEALAKTDRYIPQMHAERAAAILAALPPGWRTPLHHDPDMEERCDGRCARDECICSVEAYADEEQRRREIVAEIARLRRIEEEARRLIRENDMDRGIGFIRALDILRAALEEKP